VGLPAALSYPRLDSNIIWMQPVRDCYGTLDKIEHFVLYVYPAITPTMKAVIFALLSLLCAVSACTADCPTAPVGSGKEYNVSLGPPATLLVQMYLGERGDMACICAKGCAGYPGCGAWLAAGDRYTFPCFPTFRGFANCNGGAGTCFYLTNTTIPPTVTVRPSGSPPFEGVLCTP
jgi:hypothetical protein